MFERWLEIPSHRSCLIVGSRRSGKTTILKQRYADWPYATLDDLDYLDWGKRDPKGLISHLGKKAIIDEIQRLPMLTVAVKYAVDNEKARFLMTGSSTLGLLDAAADSWPAESILYLCPPPAGVKNWEVPLIPFCVIRPLRLKSKRPAAAFREP